MSAKLPTVTVLIPVYNGMPFIVDAVDSILSQTFQDFELLIINDGSTDGTADFLNSLRDRRIRVIHQENRGLCETLNRGVREASSQWIARLDQDDIALPNRLEKQYKFVLEHPDIVAVFSYIKRIGPSGSIFGVYSYSLNTHDPTYDPLLHGVIQHSTMFCNKAAFLSVGGYRKVFYPNDDLDLTLRLAEKFRLGAIKEPLVKYRIHFEASTLKVFYKRQMMGRYVTFCATRRRQGMSEPSLSEFLEHYQKAPFLKRFSRIIKDRGIFYFRLSGTYLLDGQIFKALCYLSLAILMDPWNSSKRTIVLLKDFFKRPQNYDLPIRK